MVKEKIMAEVNGKYNTEVLNAFDYGDYFIVEYKQATDDTEEIRFKGFLIEGDTYKSLHRVYPKFDMCLLECICCKYENCSMSHATSYILDMLHIK